MSNKIIYYILPVTPISSPVMAAAPSEARNTAVAPISDGSSKRLIHCLPRMWWFRASSTVVIEHFYDELDDIKNSKKGNIKMGIFSTLGTDIFSELMALFHKEYPLITVRFVEDGALHLKNTLLQGELDLVVMPLPVDDEFESIPFMKGDLRLVVHQNHRLADQETVLWEDLKEESFIIFREGYQVHELIMQACKLNGFEPNVICETSQWKFIMEMVSFNQGITILPQSDLEQIDVSEGKIKVIHLNPRINWQIGIAWKKDSYLSYATRTWIDFIKTNLEGSRNNQ
ncbi:DNA-binding transcriptional LysR family regulator [Peribacillus simplex]